MNDWMTNALWSLTPTAVAGVFFWVLLRLILRADRTERKVYAELEAEERRKAGLPPKKK
ncbi:MAG: hypothetical protein Q4C71_00390 [Microbacteriaceae bacterium]|nr:hypothetical protein [Microbacteriaceae bacterium]